MSSPGHRRARAPRRFSPDPSPARNRSPSKRVQVKQEEEDEEVLDVVGPCTSDVVVPEKQRSTRSRTRTSSSIIPVIEEEVEIDVVTSPTHPSPEYLSPSSPPPKRGRGVGRGRPPKKTTTSISSESTPKESRARKTPRVRITRKGGEGRQSISEFIGETDDAPPDISPPPSPIRFEHAEHTLEDSDEFLSGNFDLHQMRDENGASPPVLANLERHGEPFEADDFGSFPFENEEMQYKYMFSSMAPNVNEFGQKFLTLHSNKVSMFLKKDVIIDLITNFSRTAHTLGWVNDSSPLIPPVSSAAVGFVFLVDGNWKARPVNMRIDLLSPWSHNRRPDEVPEEEEVKLNLRAKTREVPVRLEAGRYRVNPQRSNNTPYRLCEYTAIHPRCRRLKKRVYHVCRDDADIVVGDVLILYEYMTEADETPGLTSKMSKVLDAYRKGDPFLILDTFPHHKEFFEALEEEEEERNERDEDVNVEAVDFSSELDVGAVEETVGHSGGMGRESSLLRRPKRRIDVKGEPFHDEIMVLEDNSRCVRARTTTWVKEKDIVLRLLINDRDAISPEAMSPRKPDLPPLVEELTAFCFFVNVEDIDFRDVNNDGLSPWTTMGSHSKTRKLGLVKDPKHGFWKCSYKKDWKSFDVLLYEYTCTLGRCPRLRKRISYVSVHGHPVGKVLFSYEYSAEGPIPRIDIGFQSRRITIEADKQEMHLRAKEFQDIKRGRRRSLAKHSRNTRNMFHPPPFVQEEVIEDIGSLEEEVIVHEEEEEEEVVMGHGGEEDEDVTRDAEMILDVAGGSTDPSLGLLSFVDEWNEPGPSTQPPQRVEGGGGGRYSPIPMEHAASLDVPLFGPEQHIANDPIFASYQCSPRGDICLKVHDRRIIQRKDVLLSWLINDAAMLTERGFLMMEKPLLPPLIEEDGAFAFFVCGRQMEREMKTLNKDLLTPWSGSHSAVSKTPSNSKVLRWGVSRTEDGTFVCTGHKQAYNPKTRFIMHETYVLHFRFPRLRKKVYYLMDRAMNTVIGNVVIIYVYLSPGPAPEINAKHLNGDMSRLPPKAAPLPEITDHCDLFDVSEQIITPDKNICFRVIDSRFLYDKKKILLYAINAPEIIKDTGGVNFEMPSFPPLVEEIVTFVYFVSTATFSHLDQRNLGVDGLIPWSEGHRGDPTFMRPKSKRYSLVKDNCGMFSVCSTAPGQMETEYQLIMYTATLPRCQRLKKRMYYVMHKKNIVGNILLFYIYDMEGDIPQQILPVNHGDCPVCPTRDGNPKMKSPSKFRVRRHLPIPNCFAQDLTADLSFSKELRIDYCGLLEAMRRGDIDGNSWVAEQKIQVDGGGGEREEGQIAQPGGSGGAYRIPKTEPGEATVKKVTIPTDLAIERLRRKVEAIFDFASYQLDARSEEDVMDSLWRVLLIKDEQRLLHNIKQEYGVEIINEVHVGEEDVHASHSAVDVSSSQMVHPYAEELIVEEGGMEREEEEEMMDQVNQVNQDNMKKYKGRGL